MASGHPKTLKENIEEEIDKKIDSFSDALDQKVGKEVDREIEAIIDKEIKKRVDEKIENRLGTIPTIDGQIKTFEDLSKSFQTNKERFKERIRCCLRGEGACRTISWITLVAYLLTAGLMATCALTPVPVCVSSDVFGMAPILIIVAGLTVLTQFFLAYFSKDRITSLVFAFVIDLPLIILIFFLALRFVAIVVIGLIILYYYVIYKNR